MTPADGHSGWVLPAVELALRGLGLDVSALDGFAVTTGPGSFTGLRVGISTVQGLALAAGRLCVGMSSLDVLALAATDRAPTVVALVDAFRDQVFSGVYAGDGRPLGERRVPSRRSVPRDQARPGRDPRASGGQGRAAGGAAAPVPEGRRHPQDRAVSPHALWLERAGPEDVSALAAVEAACFSHPWPRQHFAQEVAYGAPGAVLVLRSPAAREGAAKGVHAYCVYRVVVDEMLILDVAVTPDWRRRGLAAWLLRFALAKAARAGARRALLEVRRGNAPALALYQKLGFRPGGVRRDYYRQPREDALVLCREGLGAVSPSRHLRKERWALSS